MNWTLPPEGLNLLLSAVQEIQLALRTLLHALGWSTDLHGQPAWPFKQRVAGELLALESGHARRLVIASACLLAAVVALLISGLWRRGRTGLWLGAAAALVLAPWPDAHVLLAPAVPTSLHQSPTGFTAQGIVRGQAVYQQHCVRCHGADGRGEGVDAASLPMWPPTLNGALLWKQLDGELFWHVRQGLRARDGAITMPGFAQQLTDTQVWEVLDFLQANASGQMLKASGVWAYPVRMPNASIQCRHAQNRTVRDLRGQRLRVVVVGARSTPPADDPRLVTIQVQASRAPVAQPDAECRVDTNPLATALSLLLGVAENQLDNHTLLVDRDGWLRARGLPGKTAWSEEDLVCRSTALPMALAVKPTEGDGLDGLIRRMDGEPVRLLRGGFPH